MKYLLDTNVISELIAKQPNPQVTQWVDQVDSDAIYLSVVTIGELRKGVEKLPESNRKKILHDWVKDELLARFNGRILLLDVNVMLVWGELVARLEQKGKPPSAFDSLIAALAIYHHCAVVTRNVSDFKDFGIVTVNPWKE